MQRTTTATDYADRLERAVAHIWENLDADLDFAKLADVACFSPYHFHRIYRTITGETVDQTVRRLRLHRAAGRLAGRNGDSGVEPIREIAAEAGYSSVEAFSRAFSRAYGRPPSDYREGVSATQAPGASAPSREYEVEIVETPAMRLAGRVHLGDYQKIGQAFERVFAWAGPRGLITPETRSVAEYYSDVCDGPAVELRSFAGFTVGADFEPQGEIEVREIPTGRGARLMHVGPYAELETAYRYLYGAWLPGSGEQPADRPCFEEYLNDPREVPPSELRTAVVLPLEG